jgi:hypothetical protein
MLDSGPLDRALRSGGGFRALRAPKNERGGLNSGEETCSAGRDLLPFGSAGRPFAVQSRGHWRSWPSRSSA